MTGTLMGVWAHPDDETFLSSGLVLAARQRGDRVVVVTATRGELGTDDPVRWPADRLGTLRARELETALKVLGVNEHHWLGYVDGGCPEVSELEASERIMAIMDEVRPDTVVSFGPDGLTGHPDHRAVARWACRARQAAAPKATLLQAALPPRFATRFADLNASFGIFMEEPADTADTADTARPDLHLRLHGEPLDRKIEALRAQHSQTRRLIEGVGDAAFRQWWSEEAFRVLEPLADDRAAA